MAKMKHVPITKIPRGKNEAKATRSMTKDHVTAKKERVDSLKRTAAKSSSTPDRRRWASQAAKDTEHTDDRGRQTKTKYKSPSVAERAASTKASLKQVQRGRNKDARAAGKQTSGQVPKSGESHYRANRSKGSGGGGGGITKFNPKSTRSNMFRNLTDKTLK